MGSSELGSATSKSGTLSRQATHGAAWLGLVNLLSKGSQIVVTLALGAYLGRGEMGVVTIAVVMVNLGQTLQLLGSYDILSRTRHDPKVMAATLATMTVGTGVALATLLVIFAGPLANLLAAPSATGPIRLAALSLPLSAYLGVQFAYLHRSLDFRARMLPDAGGALAGAAVTVGGVIAGWGVWAPIAGIVVTAALGVVLALLTGVRIALRWNAIQAREALSWIRVVGPAALLGVLLLNLDYLVVGHVLGAEANGLYSYAYRFAFVPYIMVAVVLGGVAFPVYSRLLADGGIAAVARAFSRLLHAMLAIVTGLYLLLALLAPRIVVISPIWAPSSAVLMVLCGYGVLLCLVHTGHDATRAIGRPGAYLQAMTLHVTLLAVLVIGFAGRFGIVGVAWAQVIAAGVTCLLVYLRLWRAGVAGRAAVRAGLGPLPAAGITAGLFLLVRATLGLPADTSLPGALGVALALATCYAALLLVLDRAAVREFGSIIRPGRAAA